VDKDKVIAFPDTMTFEQGALIEPAAVGAHSTSRVTDIKGKNVVVSGAGTIGNLVAQAAKGRGARKVLITDISDYRLDIAKRCGIEHTVNVSENSFESAVTSVFGEEGFQVGFDAAGVQSSIDVLMKNIEKGGEIVILGVYSEKPVINMHYLMEHELKIIGSLMYRHEDYEEAMEMLSSGKISTEPLITRSYPFEQYDEAYKYIDSQKGKSMKVMIDV
jgi:L-iditol 2-dehydrogenase/threonine 3-dehydrogenase